MRKTSRNMILLILMAACGFPRPPDVKNQSLRIGGIVHGLWTGSDAVALRLTANGTDILYSAPMNGSFEFPMTLAEGDSYIVSLASNPTKHTCAIASGANGIVPADGVTSIDVACTGPLVSIVPSSPEPWTFDATHDIQPTLSASVLLQDVALTVTNSDGLVTSARVAGAPVTLGKPSPSMALPLGTTSIDVDLAAQGGLSKTFHFVINRGEHVITQAVYAKASNAGRTFFVVAISGDTLVVGAPGESSGATGINGNQVDTSAPVSGAVYVFQRTGSTWMQQAYIKASNTQTGDRFGTSVAISGDILAVGASGEDSNATGVNGNQTDNSMLDSGAVYIFQRTGATWAQQAYIKAADTEAHDAFGGAVALSGSTLAVGAVGESSNATGIDGDALNQNASSSGAVYVFDRTGGVWVQSAYIKASNTQSDKSFGSAVALDTDTLAAAAPYEASSSTGINGNQVDQSTLNAGAVYIFKRTNGAWAQQAYIKASNTRANQFLGVSLAIDSDTLVAGAMGESSSATGVNGNQTDTSVYAAGAVYVFQRTGDTWMQQSYIKASNTDSNDYFGSAVAIADDMIAIGAYEESSNAIGVDGNQANNDAIYSGAVYIFRRSNTIWTQQAYIKASNTDSRDAFGDSVALSRNTLAIGAPGEQSSATGIDGDQRDNSAASAGAVYLFR